MMLRLKALWAWLCACPLWSRAGAQHKGSGHKEQANPTVSPRSQPVLPLLKDMLRIFDGCHPDDVQLLRSLSDKLDARVVIGVEKYKIPLMSHTDRHDWRDFEEEMLDGLLYLMACCMNPDGLKDRNVVRTDLHRMRAAVQIIALQLRVLEERVWKPSCSTPSPT